MLRIKGFVKPSYIIHHSKNQLGNTLIPVIIALAISAVASVAFLRQGANLADQNKQLKVQYELAGVLQQWNKIKGTKAIVNITSSDLPAVANVDDLAFSAGSARTNAAVPAAGGSSGGGSLFAITRPIAATRNARLTYGPLRNNSLCESLRNTFNRDLEGIQSSICSIDSSLNVILIIYTN